MLQKEEILRQLDAGAEIYDFPMLDNGYYYHGDQKMTIFRDDKRWAILIEVLAFNNHNFDVSGITTLQSFFGNIPKCFNDNSCFKSIVSNVEAQTFLYDERRKIHYLNHKAKHIRMKDILLPIIFDKEHYLMKGIIFDDENFIAPHEFMRGLIPEYSHLFWANREDISNKIPLDLPILMTLSNWHHPNLIEDEMPSETETFQLLADVIISGNKHLYKTQEPNNTHWSNWLEGGNC